MFVLQNKNKKFPELFGSISAITINTELKKDSLYYHFSRLKKLKFENEKYQIFKCPVIRALRK